MSVIEQAARRWLQAREKVLELTVFDPTYRVHLNELSEAEAALAAATRQQEKMSEHSD